MNDDRHEIDPTRAEEYLGKTVLVGITHVDRAGSEVGSAQWHGVIEAVVPLLAIRVGDEVRILPPTVMKASPGEYRLRSTGEVVVDPDFLATWTVELNPGAPPPGDAPLSYHAPRSEKPT
ncbi:MAG TPA: hypothetical protein VHT05_04570 [Candidatus Elarobacter sp.]|nr:hypothetical protein [Candidatus Elarobacter sp.]